MKKDEINKPPENVPDVALLLEQLGAYDVAVRQNARKTLQSLGEEVLPQMVEMLPKADFVLRWEIIKALSEMRLVAAVPTLIEAMEDDEPDVRWVAAEGLAHLGRGGLRPLLRAIISNPDSIYLHRGAHHVLTKYKQKDLHEALARLRDALSPLAVEEDAVVLAEEALKTLEK
ncbi:MAG TPA: HEAT repeat domain-containing protein [Candidatus Krumholzibacteria bacterium]|nr:HEAT repeat domain-containing protein [Candidatus Krumholzibacteria bacterium]